MLWLSLSYSPQEQKWTHLPDVSTVWRLIVVYILINLLEGGTESIYFLELQLISHWDRTYEVLHFPFLLEKALLQCSLSSHCSSSRQEGLSLEHQNFLGVEKKKKSRLSVTSKTEQNVLVSYFSFVFVYNKKFHEIEILTMMGRYLIDVVLYLLIDRLTWRAAATAVVIVIELDVMDSDFYRQMFMG